MTVYGKFLRLPIPTRIRAKWVAINESAHSLGCGLGTEPNVSLACMIASDFLPLS